MADSALRKVDHSALRVNQATIIVLLLAAFIFDLWWLVAVVALVMLLGTILGRSGFLPIYFGIIRPLGIAKPYVLNDNPEPHRFAQGFGGKGANQAVGAARAGGDVAFVGCVGDDAYGGQVVANLEADGMTNGLTPPQ
jgi:hypothetical protein